MLARLLIAAAVLSSAAYAQQLPAGTREADDNSRQNAINARIEAAEAALEKGDTQGAVTMLKALAAERPKDAKVLYDLGYAQERTGDDAGAAESYAGAIATDATMAEPRVALGLLDARANRNDKAHTELQAAAALTDASPDLRARALRAMATMDESSHPDAARDELLAAIKLTHEMPEDAQMSAGLAAKAGSGADAEQAYRRALQLDPKNADAAAELAPLLQREKKPEEAEAILKTALEAHPKDPRLISQLAAVYGSEGKAQDGIDLLTQARTTDPEFAANEAVARMLARLDTMGGKDDDAVALYEKLVAAKPDDPALLDEYGGVLVKLGREAQAEAVLTKAAGMKAAFATQNDWAEVEGHLAFAASRNHHPKAALQALSARATVLPNSPASLFLEATAHDSLHETRDAVKAYRAFLAVANGSFPDQEFQARHRLIALEHQR